jgi:hypothetical protein
MAPTQKDVKESVRMIFMGPPGAGKNYIGIRSLIYTLVVLLDTFGE